MTMSDYTNVCITNLKVLNELSWILECIASTYTGEAKSGISYLKTQLDTEKYPLHTALIASLDKIVAFLQSGNTVKAAQYLSVEIRRRWDEILS